MPHVIRQKSVFRARRQDRPTLDLHRLRPAAEELEDRCLLAFDLHNGILRETFDEQAVTPQQLYAGWDDDEYVPATNGSGQSPQLVLPAIPLFHHQVTIIPNGSLYNDAAAGILPNQGDTTIADNPFIPRALNLFEVTDAITFPDINPQNNEAVSIAALDVERESYGQTVSATFVGTGDSETLTDTNQYNSTAPPAVIVAIQGSPGSGPIGVVAGAPTTPGWDTLAATSDDIGIHGKPIGPITEIDLLSIDSETIDNVRVFVGYLVPPSNSPPTAVDVTGITAIPGQPISIPVLANDSDPDGDPIHLQSVGHAVLGTAVIDPANPDQVLYTPHTLFSGHGPDTFSYTIADKYGATATANVTVVVNDPPPDAVAESYTPGHDYYGPYTVNAASGIFSNNPTKDIDGDVLTPVVIDQAAYGSVTFLQAANGSYDGSFLYTPNAPSGLVYDDTFTYALSDGYTHGTAATVHLVVPDNPPVSQNFEVEIPHDRIGKPVTLGSLLQPSYVTDPDNDPLAMNGTPVATFGSVVSDPSGDGGVTYIPDTTDIHPSPDATSVNSGLFAATVSYAVLDNYGKGTQVTITLDWDDFAPVAPNQLFYLLYGLAPQGSPLELSGNVIKTTAADGAAPADYTTLFETVDPGPPHETDLADPKSNLKPVDPDNVPTQYDAMGSPLPAPDTISDFKVVDPPTKGQIVSMDADGDFTYQAGAQFEGQDSFSYEVSDGFVFSQPAYVTIRADFAAPILFTRSYSVSENGSLGAGTAGRVYSIVQQPHFVFVPLPSSNTDVIVTAPGLLQNAQFPNGSPLSQDVVSVQVAQGPKHAEFFGSQYGFIGLGYTSTNTQLEDNGGFFYVPQPGFTGIDSFTYYVDYGLNADPNLPYAVHSTNSTGDLVTVLIDVTAAPAPPQSDDNPSTFRDSAPDHGLVTLASPAGTNLFEAQATGNPSPGDTPPGVVFPFGFLSFQVTGRAVDSSESPATTTVTLHLPAFVSPGFVYYKYGPTLDNLSPHWYDFTYDGTTGAETWLQNPSLDPNIVILHFVDGGRGDDNVEGLNGIIEDTGAPAYTSIMPEAAVSGRSTGRQGLSLSFILSVLNAGLSGPAAGFTYRINWGDGSPIDTVPATMGDGSGARTQHLFARTGTFSIHVTAVSSDGTVGPTAQKDISVQAPPRFKAVQARHNVFVAVIYQQVLVRNPEPKGLNFWAGRLRVGAYRRNVALDIIRSQERRNLVHKHEAPRIRFGKALGDAAQSERLVHPVSTLHPAGPMSIAPRRRQSAPGLG